jgi:tetratricopeptide (TPR) repeat protein
MNCLHFTFRLVRGVATVFALLSVFSLWASTGPGNEHEPQAATPAPAPISNLGASSPATNNHAPAKIEPGAKEPQEKFKAALETARDHRRKQSHKEAAKVLVDLLASNVADDIRQIALLELAAVAYDENDLARAQTVYVQFINRWPNDSRIPDVLLRQGQVFRQMGLNKLALTKFYAVMTAALSLKNDQLDYYQKLVLQAQTEIAESHYQMGKYEEAADFYARLLQQNDPALNRPQTQFRLIRSLAAIGRHAESAGQAEDYLERFPEAPEQPEVRFYLAQSLKQIGRNSDSLQQVLMLLKEQRAKTVDRPEVWAYWQQRAGNEIANQLYREGDYMKALEVYINLSQLDSSPVWRVPVSYQIGMTYERLMQPQKAIETYADILKNESTMGTNATPGIKAVFDMARYRTSFLQWQGKAENTTRELASTPAITPEQSQSTVQ